MTKRRKPRGPLSADAVSRDPAPRIDLDRIPPFAGGGHDVPGLIINLTPDMAGLAATGGLRAEDWPQILTAAERRVRAIDGRIPDGADPAPGPAEALGWPPTDAGLADRLGDWDDRNRDQLAASGGAAGITIRVANGARAEDDDRRLEIDVDGIVSRTGTAVAIATIQHDTGWIDPGRGEGPAALLPTRLGGGASSPNAALELRERWTRLGPEGIRIDTAPHVRETLGADGRDGALLFFLLEVTAGWARRGEFPGRRTEGAQEVATHPRTGEAATEVLMGWELDTDPGEGPAQIQGPRTRALVMARPGTAATGGPGVRYQVQHRIAAGPDGASLAPAIGEVLRRAWPLAYENLDELRWRRDAAQA